MTTPLQRFRELAAKAPDRVAILQGDAIATRGGLAARAAERAEGLASQGLRPGGAVVVSAPNSAEVAALVLGTWMAGGIPVFVSPHAPEDHLAFAVERTRAAVVEAPGRPDAAPAPDPGPVAAEAASVVFTSGSTGRPKGVMQSAANLLSGAERVGRLIGYAEDDVILCPVPWSHDYGWGQLLSGLCLGLPLVLPEVPSAQGLSEAVVAHRPTVLAGTPSVIAGMLYGISDIRSADLSSLRKVTSTGSHLPPELVDDLLGLMPGVAVYANYGLTETYRTACLLPHQRAGRAESVGRPIEGVRLLVVDEEGRPLPAGRVGQILHAGAGVFLGYLGDPERTAAALRTIDTEDGPLRAVATSDLGHLDAEGFLFLQGRKDRVVKTMDVQVSLDEVEKRLSGTGLVARVAVVAVPHKVMGRKIVAHVVLKDPALAPELKRRARQALSKFQLPGEFRFPEALPLTPSGKIDYLALSGGSGATQPEPA